MNGNDAVRGDAGRELDALVAERVMGWRADVMAAVREALRGVPAEVGGTVLPHYSTEIADAWEVVERMREHPDVRRRTLRLVAYSYNRTYATFNADADAEDWSEANGEHATPLAICRAALAATAECVIPQSDPSAEGEA